MTKRELSSQELRDIFDADDFDPIQYINSRFPDEGSLGNLDQEISMLKEELSDMNKDLVESIHNHALSNTQLQEEIKVAHQTTKDVIEQISIIKVKAERSEELVFDMCKDIKSLDTAKKNLTFSITALKKFIMMLTAVDKLRDCCEHKIYKEVANLISAFNELSLYIQKYQNIPQIQELFKVENKNIMHIEKEDIVTELKLQLREDFEAFFNASTTLTASDMADACQVVETMGVHFQKEIIDFVCNLTLNSYKAAFARPENATLDQHERRFAWLTRSLDEFERKWQNVFPEYWTIVCKLIHEFCSQTFVSSITCLEKSARTTDVQVFMKALSSTVSFESRITKDMERKYRKYISEVNASAQEGQEPNPNMELLKTKKDFVQTRLPNFKGTISKAFEQYLSPYSERKEQDLYACINDGMADERVEPDLKVLNSYLVMQSFIRQLIQEAASYGMNQLMIEISRVIKSGLRFYSDKLIRKMENDLANRGRDVEAFQASIGYTINTSECWKENIKGLEESIRSKLDPAYYDSLDISNEGELFANVISKGIDCYLTFVDITTENSFNTLSKLNWQQMSATDTANDSTDCMKEIRTFVIQHTEQIKLMISEVYLFFYLQKLAALLNMKFIATIFKLRSLGEGAVTQLMIYATELENSLLELAKKDEQQQSRKIGVYTTSVKKTFAKTKNVLKLLNMPNQEFLDNFSNFFEDATQADLEKLILVKGIKRIDAQNLFKQFSK